MGLHCKHVLYLERGVSCDKVALILIRPNSAVGTESRTRALVNDREADEASHQHSCEIDARERYAGYVAMSMILRLNAPCCIRACAGSLGMNASVGRSQPVKPYSSLVTYNSMGDVMTVIRPDNENGSRSETRIARYCAHAPREKAPQISKAYFISISHLPASDHKMR